jgi:hypothetical protein
VASDPDVEERPGRFVLDSLRLDTVRVSDNGLRQLEPLTSLRSITLWDTDVTEQGITRLEQALPQLTVDATKD